MRYNIGYKVVFKKRNGDYLSTNALLSMTPDCMKLKYEVGKTTEPVVGKLFVFDELGAAMKYADISTDYVVMKGVVKNLQSRKIKQVLGGWDFTVKSLNNFWKNPETALKDAKGWQTPVKTCFCDTFKPLEVLK